MIVLYIFATIATLVLLISMNFWISNGVYNAFVLCASILAHHMDRDEGEKEPPKFAFFMMNMCNKIMVLRYVPVLNIVAMLLFYLLVGVYYIIMTIATLMIGKPHEHS